MSRVGKAPIKVVSGVKLDLKGQLLKVEGPKGKLSFNIPTGVSLDMGKDEIKVLQNPDHPKAPALQGVTRTQVQNMVTGVSTGFVRELDIVGVGFRAAVKGSTLSLTVGFSHPVEFKFPDGVTGKVDGNTHIVLSGSDKMILGLTADKIRGIRPPEPYQGKGIRYTNERIIRKAGKAAGGK